MSEPKQEKYLHISKEIVEYVGGMDNIQGTAHYATRLRIVLKNNRIYQYPIAEINQLRKNHEHKVLLENEVYHYSLHAY